MSDPTQKSGDDVRDARIAKIDALAEAGTSAFANNFKVTHAVTDIRAAHGEKDAETLATVTDTFAVAGRLMSYRSFGKSFCGSRVGRITFSFRNSFWKSETSE